MGQQDGDRVSDTARFDDEREDAPEFVEDFSDDQNEYDGDQFDLDARLSLTRVRACRPTCPTSRRSSTDS